MACSIHTMPADNGRSEKATSRSTWVSLAYPLRNFHLRFQFVSPRLVRFSDSRMCTQAKQIPYVHADLACNQLNTARSRFIYTAVAHAPVMELKGDECVQPGQGY